MSAPDDFAPEVVEAVARAIYLGMYGADGGKWEAVDPRYQEAVWGKKALDILRDLRGLGVLAGPGECVVPREPTEAMLIAGARRSDDFWSEKGPYCRTKAVYRAMLAAAPRAGTEGGQ